MNKMIYYNMIYFIYIYTIFLRINNGCFKIHYGFELITKASEASWSYSCDSKVSFDRVQILTPDFSGRRPPPLKSRAYLYRVPLQQPI